MIEKSRRDRPLPATDSTPQPGDFPPGSLKSRAAARAKLERVKSAPGPIHQVRIIHVGGRQKGETLPARERFEFDGGAFEFVHVSGWTMKPGDFPIGSPESRAAARMLAANRQDTRKRVEIITNAHMPWPGKGPDPDPWNNEEPHIGPGRDCVDVLMRFVYVPDGMSDDQLRKDVGF